MFFRGMSIGTRNLSFNRRLPEFHGWTFRFFFYAGQLSTVGIDRIATKSLTSPLPVSLDFPPSQDKMAMPFFRECLQGPR